MNMVAVEELLLTTDNFIKSQESLIEHKEGLKSRIDVLNEQIHKESEELDLLIRAATLIGNVSDENTSNTLNRITGIINKALAVLFPHDPRSVKVQKVMYRTVYTHFVVELTTSAGKKRSFKQSGSGLAQVISFLFTISLIDARKGRKIVVMDELLNGLHPDAKLIIMDLIKALSNRFQFILTEYGLDVGTQYEVVNKNETSTISLYESGTYYMDLYKKRLISVKDIVGTV